MNQRIYNSKTGEWEIVSASNASNLELSNPSYVDNLGKTVSVDRGFTILSNRINKLESNLAFVYLNGTVGGGGSGGGEGEEVAYTIELDGDTTRYTADGTVNLAMMIKSGSIKKSFTVQVKNLTTNQIVGTWKQYSLQKFTIALSNITESTNFEISAFDTQSKYATPIYVNVIAGAIQLDIQKYPNKTIYIGSVDQHEVNFVLTNNVRNSPATFTFKMNGTVIDEKTELTVSELLISYSLRDVIFKGTTPEVGTKFRFSAQAYTYLGTAQLLTKEITFEVTVADSNNLIIVTEEIAEVPPTVETWETLTTYNKGSQISFPYYLSYGKSTYEYFDLSATIEKVTSTGSEVVVTVPSIQIRKGTTLFFIQNTLNLEVSKPGEYLKITLFANASNAPEDVSAQYTKEVYCKIGESTYVELTANNDDEQLLAYFSKLSFPSNPTGTWTYKAPTSGPFKYSGVFNSVFPDGVNLVTKNVNGTTTGFIANSDGINKIPAIVLSGESYAYAEVAEYMFPNKEIEGNTNFFKPLGFHISTTFQTKESTNNKATILSIGKYENDILKSGFEITQKKATVRVGTALDLDVDIPQGVKVGVDLDVYLVGEGWYFNIYLDGILSKVGRVAKEYIDWKFGTDLYLGCRYENGITNNYSDVTIYDFKIYTSSQNEFAIVQNSISSKLYASLVNGEIDQKMDSDLRLRNLFTPEGECLIWDRANKKYIEGPQLYNQLMTQVTTNLPHYLVLVEETSSSFTLFEPFSTAVFSAADKDTVMKQTFPCKITITDMQGNTETIITPAGVDPDKGVRIGIQGTSSLSYNSKNFELYIGDQNPEGKPLLVQVKDDWLPENEFTLKADVMDSAHVNNVVIGKIINGEVKNEAGQTIQPFPKTPPMTIDPAVFGGAENAEKIQSRMKYTSDGFPCLLFIKFAPDKQGNTREPKFMGIYNFNLGRYAKFNLGMRLLTSYEKAKPEGPTIVTEFTEAENYFNESGRSGMHSVEINQNNSAQGAFQQDDLAIIKFMADVIFTSTNEQDAYDKVQRLYNQLANMALTKIPKYTMTSDGQSPTQPKDGFYDLDLNTYYNFQALMRNMNWDSAVTYFLIIIIFGMVDSACKNLTLRNWGTLVWFLAVYDADTAFGLENSGQDSVAYWAHLHRFFNKSEDTGITVETAENYYKDSYDRRQYYASSWNRIWEVLENLPIKDATAVTESTNTIQKVYKNLRTNLFPDPAKFIDDYYSSYTRSTGAIIFNYDYKIKYLQVSKTYDINTGQYTDKTDFSQLKFLNGNRVVRAKEWFINRVYFLDGVYGEGLPTTVLSPQTTMWQDNKVNSPLTEDTYVNLTISAKSKMLFKYDFDKTSKQFWIDEGDQEVRMYAPGGQAIATFYANKFITKFDPFNSYNWTALASVDMPLLKKVDLTNLANITNGYFFNGGVWTGAYGLRDVEELILKGVKIEGQAVNLDVSKCEKLQRLDISDSTITSVTLPINPVLKHLDYSGTAIIKLKLENQAFLHTVLLDNCNELTDLEIVNCHNLKTLTIPSSVVNLKIAQCSGLETLNIPYQSMGNKISVLNNIIIDTCPGLKSVNLSGQNLNTLTINLLGAPNLEELNLRSVVTTQLILPPLTIAGTPNFSSLKSLDISSTNFTSFTYGSEVKDGILDLSNFPNLDNIQAYGCKKLVIVECPNNPDNPIDLQSGAFLDCSSLKRVTGHFNLVGQQVFKYCSSLVLNTENIYNTQDPTGFLLDTETEKVTNIQYNTASLFGTFDSCSSLTYNDFKFIMARLNPTVQSLESFTSNCRNIIGPVWRELLSTCPNLTNLKNAFNNTALSGILYSRSTTEKGFFDYTPSLSVFDSAFKNSAIEWIDNNLFKGDKASLLLTTIDNCFAMCANLKVAQDTNAEVLVEGILRSEDFFLNLENLITNYPSKVFEACRNISMEVSIDSNNNTLLFHTKKDIKTSVVLDNSLYSGVRLVGTITPNVFGGVSQQILEGESVKYYIPAFSAIQSPFSNCVGNELLIDFSIMGDMFQSISKVLRQCTNLLSGLNFANTPNATKFPTNVFRGCSVLNTLTGFCSHKDFDNGGIISEFPFTYEENGIQVSMFKDCASLKNTNNFLSGCTKFKFKLVGDRFTNCKLDDVSGMFSRTSLFGVIPYKLFRMETVDRLGKPILNRSITKMSNLFSQCWCLGYDRDRIIKHDGEYLWDYHIVEVPGTPIYYSVNKQDLKKVYNFEKTLDTDPDYVFDSWLLDGCGYDTATSTVEGFAEFKASLQDSVFKYDDQQKLVIEEQGRTQQFMDTFQNYAIPTDLFRYCSDTANLSSVLNNITWNQNVEDRDEITNALIIRSTDKIEGLRGRLPVKLFKSLTGIQSLANVLTSTNFEAFVGCRTEANIRGIMYPPDLLKYNSELINVDGLCSYTKIYVGVDINSDLFSYNSKLQIASNVWNTCSFDSRAKNIDEGSEPTNAPQIDFENIFKPNTFLKDVSGIFSVNRTSTTNEKYGLLIINNNFCSTNKNLNNISNMFYGNAYMVGNVPTFLESAYPSIRIYSGYIEGTTKQNILNLDILIRDSRRLVPAEWLPENQI